MRVEVVRAKTRRRIDLDEETPRPETRPAASQGYGPTAVHIAYTGRVVKYTYDDVNTTGTGWVW